MNLESRIQKLEKQQREKNRHNRFSVTIQNDAADQFNSPEPDNQAELWINIIVKTILNGTAHKVKDLGTIERRRAENEY